MGLVQLLHEGGPVSRGSVVITFDDAYRGLAAVGQLLTAHRMHATVFLPTGLIGREENQWSDVLYSAFRHAAGARLALDGRTKFDLTTRAGHDAIRQLLLPAANERRREILADAVDQLRPSRVSPRRIMNWDEVRCLDRECDCFDLGVHTVDHLDMSGLDRATAMGEVRESIRQFERQLGRAPRHMSFPYSRASQEVCGSLGELQLAAAIGETSIATPSGSFRVLCMTAPQSLRALARVTLGRPE